MVQKTIEVYSDASNQAVVRMPGRQFPGIVLQGDSVRQLLQLTVDAETQAGKLLEDGTEGVEELSATLAMLRECIESYLAAYEQTLSEHGVELPYEK